MRHHLLPDFAERVLEYDKAPARRHEQRATDPLLDLQRSAGNRATVDALEALGVQTKLRVGAANDVHEREADDVARAVVARLGTPSAGSLEVASAHDRGPAATVRRRASIGTAGGEVDAETEQEIGHARSGGRPLSDGVRQGMERAFGADFSSVRVHDGPASAQLNDRLQSSAFTLGTDVFFRGRAPEGTDHRDQELLAHELTHVVQQTGGGQSVQRRVIQRKLRGTRDAIEAMAGDLGGTTTTGLRKLIHAKTNWDRILDGVAAYEALEEALLKGGANPSVEVLTSAKPKLLKVLRGIQSDIKSWKKANDQDEFDDKSDKARKNVTEKGGKQVKSDDRTKASRRQVVAMLEPRVGEEISLLESKDPQAWSKSLGLSPSLKPTLGVEKGGQKNSVRELTYQTEAGPFSGYFKKDSGFSNKLESHELDVGINQTDPNYGARTVAMYKLDKLFGADVTARAEFAVHTDKEGKSVLGTVLESAKGVQASEAKIALDKGHRDQMGEGAISFDDPVLQRGMNKLQIFDAICGQLDRHEGNFYIQMDEKGNVTGVTGIDLDMAFGKEMNTHDDKSAKFAQNYKGLPAKIDAEFGRRLLQVTAKDVEDALRGLLPPAEIQATVNRFKSVQDKVRELNGQGKLTDNWDRKTAWEGIANANQIKFGFARDSYRATQAFTSLIAVKRQLLDLTEGALGHGYGPKPFEPSLFQRIEDFPEPMKQVFVKGLAGKDTEAIGAVAGAVAVYVYDNQMGSAAADLTMLVCNELLRDYAALNKFAVTVQENASFDWSNAKGFYEPFVENYLKKALAELKKWKPAQQAPPSGPRQPAMMGRRGR